MAQNSGDTPLDITDEFTRALALMESPDGDHVFLTGRAGTGKSTLLQHFRRTTKKNIVILAPTGVAAVNVRGQTIHSFFKFSIGVTPDHVRTVREKGDDTNIYKKLDAIVIDEVSMVRADLMDCIDAFLRRNGPNRQKPFGGVQMIFVGDMYQLPPVVTSEDEDLFKTRYRSPYFFDAKVFEKTGFFFVELQKIYRQTNQALIEILNAVRLGKVNAAQLAVLNTRYVPNVAEGFSGAVLGGAAKGASAGKSGAGHVRLMTTNAMADSFNEQKLAQLPGKFSSLGGAVSGEFKRNLPTSQELRLKPCARVMMLTNAEKWINGDLAEVVSVSGDESEVVVRLEESGEECAIVPYTWEMLRFFYDVGSKKIESKAIGKFTQFPVRLAWALSIHKGQGKTYNNVIVDFGRGTFAHGQAYVALSRCRTLEGLVLRTPLSPGHIIVDSRIADFMADCQSVPAGVAIEPPGSLALDFRVEKDREIEKNSETFVDDVTIVNEF